jgi:Tol biopolymer transport system component
MVAIRLRAVLVAIVALASTSQPTRTFVTVRQKDAGRSLAAISPIDISPDGRYVAFESYAQLVPADTDTHRDIYLLDRVDGRVTLESGMFETQTDAAHPRISADARYLTFEAEVLGSRTDQLRIDIVVVDRLSGVVKIVRGPDGAIPNGSSHSPEISDDGRTVAFSSVATNLVEGVDANGSLEDVYTFDVASGVVRRISVDNAGKQLATGFSFAPSINADGRITAFTSSAPFTTASPHETVTASDARRFALRQVYVRDENTATTTQVSVMDDGSWPDGASVRPSISGDGRYVAFSSEASRLVKDDGNRAPDIFVHDRKLGTTRLITRAPDGHAGNGRSIAPALSADGRFVAFQSDASNLVCAKRCLADDEDVNLLWDVFVWDRDENRIVRVSEDYLGGWMEPSIAPAIDGHGTVVAFTSRHPVDASDRGGDFDLFVRELPDPLTTLVRQRGTP